MKILVACEFSGIVRDAFRAAGHDAWSVDLLPTEADVRWHIQGDALMVMAGQKWDMIIAHPPCTDLASIGAASWQIKRANGDQQRAAWFFKALYDAPCERVCVENPVGIMSSIFRKPDQYVDPWQFGDPFKKRTGLWLRGLPLLKPEVLTVPIDVDYFVTGQRAGAFRVHTKQTHKGKNGTRGHARSKFFPGIARAMAEQWG